MTLLTFNSSPSRRRPRPRRRRTPRVYSPGRLAALRAEGRPVFVNMTAAWCVTCLVNERVALSSDKVRDAFAKRNVAYLKGDWTRADPAISEFLKQHGRDGVPLYVSLPSARRSAGGPAANPDGGGSVG